MHLLSVFVIAQITVLVKQKGLSFYAVNTELSVFVCEYTMRVFTISALSYDCKRRINGS